MSKERDGSKKLDLTDSVEVNVLIELFQIPL